MQTEPSADQSRQQLHDIRRMMERSSRFLSLSGWSGIWAGCTALVGALIAFIWLPPELLKMYDGSYGPLGKSQEAFCFCGAIFSRTVTLALMILIIALAGAYFFTARKMRREGASLSQPASRRMLWAMALPMIVGAFFVFAFMRSGHPDYLTATCLVFYGLALINGSNHTLGEIRNLGYLQIVLGVIALFLPGWGLYFWIAGFGFFHIVYGIMMWNKYDKLAAA